MSIKDKVAALKAKGAALNAKPVEKAEKIPPKGGSSTAPVKAPPKPPKAKKPRVCSICGEKPPKHRLPNAATITKIYDAAEQMWWGKLTVDGTVFTATTTSCIALDRLLDHAWQDATFPPGKRPYELSKIVVDNAGKVG